MANTQRVKITAPAGSKIVITQTTLSSGKKS